MILKDEHHYRNTTWYTHVPLHTNQQTDYILDLSSFIYLSLMIRNYKGDDYADPKENAGSCSLLVGWQQIKASLYDFKSVVN